MKKLLLLLLSVLYCVTLSAQNTMLNGDLDHDGQITVADIVIMSNIVLENRSAEVISGDFTIEEPTPTYTIYYGNAGKTFDASTYDFLTNPEGSADAVPSVINLEGDSFFKYIAIPKDANVKISTFVDMTLGSEVPYVTTITDDTAQYSSKENGDYVVYYMGNNVMKDSTTYKITLINK